MLSGPVSIVNPLAAPVAAGNCDAVAANHPEGAPWARRDSNSLSPPSELWKSGKQGVVDVSKHKKSFDSDDASSSNDLQQNASVFSPFATSVLQAAVAKGGGGSGFRVRLLSAREVAERLRICTATVYRLCERGELGYVRISNAVRVPEAALQAFVESSARLKRPNAVA